MNSKKIYASPVINVFTIFMEDSISSASARIDPLDGNEQIIETWIDDPEERKSFTW